LKKYISIAAASLLTASLFVGCGSDDGTKTGTLEDSPVDGVTAECTSVTSTTKKWRKI
jgi:hypothetical protein